MSKTTKDDGHTTKMYVNGSPKAIKITDSDGNSTTNYIMSPWENEAYNYTQREFVQNLPNVNVFSKDTIEDLNKQLEAYKKRGVKNINDIYNPMLKDLQNDIASRFGNLDNSIFLDKLSEIEDKRADSISDLAQDITAQRQELIENELENRYDYLNFLNNYQNQINSYILGTTNSNNSLGGTKSNNDSLIDSEIIKDIASIIGQIIASR